MKKVKVGQLVMVRTSVIFPNRRDKSRYDYRPGRVVSVFEAPNGDIAAQVEYCVLGYKSVSTRFVMKNDYIFNLDAFKMYVSKNGFNLEQVNLIEALKINGAELVKYSEPCAHCTKEDVQNAINQL